MKHSPLLIVMFVAAACSGEAPASREQEDVDARIGAIGKTPVEPVSCEGLETAILAAEPTIASRGSRSSTMSTEHGDT